MMLTNTGSQNHAQEGWAITEFGLLPKLVVAMRYMQIETAEL